MSIFWKKCSLSKYPVCYLYYVCYPYFTKKTNAFIFFLLVTLDIGLPLISAILAAHAVHKRVRVQNALNIFPTLSYNAHRPINIYYVF